ncbi:MULTISPECIES: DUF4835 family protein [unclassified Myroides]|uniref:type IX secretion system protein PorD n=1 Tax=unclassified Myroides TaxID=2642485 RepID=UPI0015FB96AA|nr:MULTISPECIES: DUF4835 family protein [unclassified Myroides]MBB1150406.1 DUF4835 family protein [Myroides sp. NP-2]MDM1407354.1 DUF4835 family protein [Myroides sp. DF42-4-2]
MNKLFGLFACFFLWIATSQAQELNANVSVNFAQVGNTHQNYFRTLEKSLKELLNQTNWSSQRVNPNEKIDCTFLLTVSSFDNNANVSGTLQVQFGRPVFNTTYSSPVLNFNDKDIAFSYTEFEPLRYSAGSYESNLISLISFYVNIILGMDSDTFSKEGGTAYYQEASLIASMAQQSNAKGWKQGDGTNTRYVLVNDLSSGASKPFREALYNYHRLGLDLMSEGVEQGRNGVFQGLNDLRQYNAVRSNAFLIRVFFDTKTEELVNLYSGVTDPNKKRVVEILHAISPLNASKWNNL